MPSPWKSVFFELPINNQIVWIRVLAIYGEPVLAQYMTGPGRFVTVTTGVQVSEVEVARWKPQ